MNPEGSDDPKQDDANHGIGYCVPWRDKRTVGVCGDLSPVKGDWNQRDSSPPPKKLVYHDVVGADPDDEREDTEEGRDEAGKPVPTEGTDKNDEEVFVTGDAPAVALGGVGL